MKWSVYEGPIRRKRYVDEPIIVKLDIDMMGPDRQKYTLLSGSLGSRKFHFREMSLFEK